MEDDEKRSRNLILIYINYQSKIEISPDTNFIINLGTIVACGFFLWKLSANISKFKEHTDICNKMDMNMIYIDGFICFRLGSGLVCYDYMYLLKNAML